MPSRVVKSIVFEDVLSRLTVTFVSGRIYQYYMVPRSMAAAFEAARSKGTFFNKFIRDSYTCREVAPREAASA
ncbi:MAG: KTSC domain-containing protein [Pseudolabrys sp.]|jgi:hypothetical protein